MKEINTNKINDINISWEGYAGYRVEEFIKEQLNSKSGYFYYDATANRYLVFANEATKDLYLETLDSDLLLGAFDAPFNYTAEINLATPTYNTISLGSTGNIINFTFDIKNKQGASTGENALITYTISKGSTKTEFKEYRSFGSAISFSVDKYLEEGTNTITINVVGQTSLAATTVAINYEVVNLNIIDYLDISKVYNLKRNDIEYLEIPYEVSGSYTKLMEWYLDGVKLEFNRLEDEILETVPINRTKSIELKNLSHGKHNIQFRVSTKVNGETFYSDTLYRDFFITTELNDHIMLGIAINIPYKYGIIKDSNPIIYDMVQYVNYTLHLSSYSPLNISKTEVNIYLDNELINIVISSNGIVSDIPITSLNSGDKTLTFKAIEVELESEIDYNIPIKVSPTSMNITEITEGLKLNFTAVGKSNSSLNKDTWEYEDITGTLTGFKWNNTSGWVNGRLEFDADSELSIDYSPLSNHDNGKTIEIEWKSKNVSNEDAIICDLRNDRGTGILITATGISITSYNKSELIRKYKSEEDLRVAIVINPNRGTNKGLTFIYINGIISGAVNILEGDNYISDKKLVFKGSSEAGLSLKYIKIYDSALNTDQIVNNFNLYRDSLSEMFDIYDRNDIYENNEINPTKLASRLPVMIITGDIPVLENTNDKDTQITVDIEYINLQDPNRSFIMKKAAMRPQGTSSMGYPKKNFRIYTKKREDTILEVNGKIVEDKLYSFKEGAIPVDCWCLKADYAESSGTHNTGIAKLWGNAFKNARVTCNLGEGNPNNVEEATVLRTKAQQCALDNKYPYDVRTTIDGFPILMFYKRTENDNLVFIGKYNFNNDKSTEKVFGFTDIEGFDNSRMQCWELLNNGNSIGLFTDISKFYSNVVSDGKTKKGWELAFESRYPDTKTPNTTDLYNFSVWLNEINGNHDLFKVEKWDHFDVYKVAGYYCYLMRHGGADQFVKNAMLTSEDGEHFYFILYDNDTINGLNNAGEIAILPTDNRNSTYPTGSYKFAGHESVLWNMLEADDEFQTVVRAVDNALTKEEVSYGEVINMFDIQQAGKWVERIYNLDAEYKYITPYTQNGTNNLFMLQGKRDLHRKWWLSNRYSLYDSLFVSGAYKSKNIQIKCIDGTVSGQEFDVISGYPIYYGYGINGILRQRTIEPLLPNEMTTFTVNEDVNLGDPIAIYGAAHIKELDVSAMMDRIASIDLTGAYDTDLGTKLEKLFIGSKEKTNTTLLELSGINNLISLQVLDVTNCKGLTSLNLSSNKYLKEFKASGTNIVSATFAEGSPLQSLYLPLTFKTIDFKSLPLLNYSNINHESFNEIESIKISNCPNLSNDFNWVYNWYVNKNIPNETTVFHMDNIYWENVDYQELIELANIRDLNLKGKVLLKKGSQEIINAIREVFGDTVFNKASDFYVQSPPGVYLTGPTKLLEGESARFVAAIFSENNGRVIFKLITGRDGCKIDEKTGYLSTEENGLATSDIVIRANFIPDKGDILYTDITVTIEQRTYPTAIEITGDALINTENHTFNLVTTPAEVTGLYTINWTLGEEATEYLEIESFDNTSCTLKRIKEGVIETSITATVVKNVNGSIVKTTTRNISLVIEGVVITKSSNAPLQECLYKNGLVAHEDYSEAWELALITADQLQPETSTSSSIFYPYIFRITSLSELKYFTGLTRIKSYTFSYSGYVIRNIKIIELPNSIEFIEEYAFNRIAEVEKVVVPDNVVITQNYSFYNCDTQRLYIPNLEKWANSVYTYNANWIKEDGSTKIFVENFEKEVEEVVFDFPVSDITSGNGRYNFYNWKSVKRWVINHSEARVVFAETTGDLYINVNISGENIQRPLGDIYIGKNVTSISGDFVYTPYNNVHIDTLEHWFKMDFGMARSNPLGGDYSLYVGDSEVPEDIVIPDSITEVKPFALNRWNKPKSVRFHKDVTSISDIAINLCPNIEQLVVDSNNNKYDSRENCNAVIESDTDKLIIGCISTRIPEGVKIVVSKAFNNIVPETLDLPSTIEQIVGDVFKQSRNLKKINIHSLNTWLSVGHMLADDFYGSRSLYLNGELIEDFIIPDGVEKVNNPIFDGILLKSITIPPSVKEASAICYAAIIEKLIIKKRRGHLAFSSSSFAYCKTLRELYVDDLETYMYCNHGSSGGVSFFNSVPPEFYSETKLFVNDKLLENLVLTPDLYEIAKNNGTWKPIFANIGSIKSVYVESGGGYFDAGFLSGCLNVKTISIESNAFYAGYLCFGSSDTTYTGRNTYTTGENTLYVPQGATGYDAGNWLDPLQNAEKCGFTLKYLPDPTVDTVGTWIKIDQTITDPATMISGDINGEHIQMIRNNSHRYLGKYTADGTMTVCQLDDNDSTKYADGTVANLTGSEGDVFMKMPNFYYRSVEESTDVWKIGFYCGNEAPNAAWIKWDTNALIGVYEAYSVDSKVYSRSGVESSVNISQANFNAYARNRGNGFRIVDWQMHCVMAILFYAQYGHTNCQEKIGAGTSSSTKECGQTDACGMNDTKGTSPVIGLNDAGADGNAQSINFCGLENWWGNKLEWIDNVVIDAYEWKITEPDGTVRTPGFALKSSSTFIGKLMFGANCDLVPTNSGGTDTTGFCDTYLSSSSSACVVRRSSNSNNTNGGIAFVDSCYTSSSTNKYTSSRIAFRGQCVEEESVEQFKSLTAIG